MTTKDKVYYLIGKYSIEYVRGILGISFVTFKDRMKRKNWKSIEESAISMKFEREIEKK